MEYLIYDSIDNTYTIYDPDNEIWAGIWSKSLLNVLTNANWCNSPSSSGIFTPNNNFYKISFNFNHLKIVCIYPEITIDLLKTNHPELFI